MPPMDSSASLYFDSSWMMDDTYPDLFDEKGETDLFSRQAMIATSFANPSNSSESCMSKVEKVVGGVCVSPSQCMADINAAISTAGCFSTNPLLYDALPAPSNSGESCMSKVEQVCGVVGGSTQQHIMAAINVALNSGAADKSIPALRESAMAEQFAQTEMWKARGPGGFDMNLVANSRPKRRNVKISKDPQSVAARHRRERISDRIRILQRLVPGGTKMDTASMLDEAIHYVKFLKAQLHSLEKASNTHSTSFDSRLAFAASSLYRNGSMAGVPHSTLGIDYSPMQKHVQ